MTSGESGHAEHAGAELEVAAGAGLGGMRLGDLQPGVTQVLPSPWCTE